MAPVPQSPSTQLAALARRLTDMRTYQLPRLLACPGPLALHQQYASELREDLEGVLRGVRALELLVEGEEDDGREALAGQLQLGQLRAELDRLKRDARAAVLQSKRAIEAKSTRAELLAGAAPDSALDKSADALTNTSNEVTLALRRTMAAMQQEVERSVLSTQLLDASSRTLHAASHSYLSLTTLLNTSRTLITALERADWMDRALIFAALAFFLLVLAFILKQRIFDRGVRLAFWWLRFLPSFGDEGLGLEEVAKKARGSVQVVTSLLTTTTTALAAAASLAHKSQEPTVVVETVTSVITVSKTLLDSPTSIVFDASSSVEPSHTLEENLVITAVSPTDAPEPEAEEWAFTEDTFPDEATPLTDPWTVAPPAEASPPRHRVEL